MSNYDGNLVEAKSQYIMNMQGFNPLLFSMTHFAYRRQHDTFRIAETPLEFAPS